MLNSILCDFSGAYIIVSRTRTVTGAGDDAAARKTDERNKEAIIKSCAPFLDCISQINNTQVDNAKDLDVVILVYTLVEQSDNN